MTTLVTIVVNKVTHRIGFVVKKTKTTKLTCLIDNNIIMSCDFSFDELGVALG